MIRGITKSYSWGGIKLVCKYCKKQYGKGYIFCPDCGNKLEIAENLVEKKIDDSSLNKKMMAALLER